MNSERIREVAKVVKDGEIYNMDYEELLTDLFAILDTLTPPATIEECEAEIGEASYFPDGDGFYMAGDEVEGVFSFYGPAKDDRDQLLTAQAAWVHQRVTALREGDE